MNMKEEFVTYQQAVALKECGFDWKCQFYYTQEDTPKGEVWFTANVARLDYNNMHDNEGNLINYVYSAPTQALAQKWMREVKNWHIIIEPYNYHGIKTTEYLYRLYNPIIGFENHNQRNGFVSYESALSAGLDACLELIRK